MENSVLHKAATRGAADHGWLNAKHTFSFANYYDQERIHFGALRVLNDDTIAGGMGFGKHPHDNMEIITIPLEGDIEHQDSMGNKAVISHGQVQVMSAGTGIQHSEYNHNQDVPLKLLQIWLFPNKKGVVPRSTKLHLTLQTGIINCNKFYLPILRMLGFGFTKMLGFIWGISIKELKQFMILRPKKMACMYL